MVPSCWRPDREGVAAANESCDGVGKPSLPKQLTILRVHPRGQHRTTVARENSVLDRELHQTSNVKRLLLLSSCGRYKYLPAALHLEARCLTRPGIQSPSRGRAPEL